MVTKITDKVSIELTNQVILNATREGKLNEYLECLKKMQEVDFDATIKLLKLLGGSEITDEVVAEMIGEVGLGKITEAVATEAGKLMSGTGKQITEMSMPSKKAKSTQ